MRTVFRNTLVSAAGLFTVLVFAPAFEIAGLAQATTPQTATPADSQSAVPKDQVHAITGLPLPPDDPNYVPPAPAPKPLTRAQKLAAARKAATEAANARIAAKKAAAAEKAAAAKAATEKAAADREAARAAAAEKAEADKKAAAEKIAADRAAAADKAAAAKAAADEAAATKAAAEEKAAAAKAAAEKAAADREAARKAAADKLAADRAAAAEKAATIKAANQKALADKEAARKVAADKAAAEKAKAADKAAADKAAADKLAADRAAEKAAAAKAAADKAAEDRIAAEKAAAASKAAAEAKANRSPFVPRPTTVIMPSSIANSPEPLPVVPPVTTVKPSVVRPPVNPLPEEPAPVKASIVKNPSAPATKPSPAPAPATAPAPAAAPPAPTSGVAAIVFFGAEPFTPAELTPVTGLTLGTNPSSTAIQTASQRLIDTGLFSNVAATYDLNGALGTATFSLKPAAPDQLLRASFANFVWLTPAELSAALKSVAFYHGLVPTIGNLNMPRDIENALAAALKARGVTATITHAVIPPTDLHPYPAMEFRVTDPDTVLETAQVTDVPPALINKFLKAQDDAVKMNYNEGSAGVTLTDVLLAPAREAGYLGARLTRVEHRRKVTPGAVYIDYSARLETGPVYNVRTLNWTPSPIYTAADFKRDCALQVGKHPSAEAQNKTEAAILASYRAQGYLEAAVASTYKLDPASGGVDYTFTATAGPQYHLHSLTVHGLSDQAQKDFDGAWTIQPGDIYNEDYLTNFLTAHSNIASLNGYSIDYNRTTTPDTHEVDLTINFKPAK